MPRDVVVVLAYWRPNYISQCLDALSKCEGIEDMQVLISQDDRVELPKNRRYFHDETTAKIKIALSLFKSAELVKMAPHSFSRTTDQTAGVENE